MINYITINKKSLIFGTYLLNGDILKDSLIQAMNLYVL